MVYSLTMWLTLFTVCYGRDSLSHTEKNRYTGSPERCGAEQNIRTSEGRSEAGYRNDIQRGFMFVVFTVCHWSHCVRKHEIEDMPNKQSRYQIRIRF